MTPLDHLVQNHDPSRPLKVACLGESMVELSDLDAPDNRVTLGFAGDTLNCAIYLARVLDSHPVEVSYLTALGMDALSDRMVQAIAQEGVGTGSIVRFDDKLPGLYAIEVDDKGERSFRYWRSQSAAKSMLSEGGLSDSAILDLDVLVLSAISLAILPPQARKRLIGLCGRMQAAGKVVAFDSNYRPALWVSREEAREAMTAMWPVVSLALPSRDDEAQLWPEEEPLELFSRLGCPEIGMKDGPEGPLLWAGEPQAKEPFARAEAVVDTTSAGDSFNAGYIAGRLLGKRPADAAQMGHTLAKTVIGHRGAIIPRDAMPSFD